ncbi:MAG: hypothetical protein A3D27_02770 [Omnitrophica WOR_2 bacterium RIFCSPHIGHO2_02_FULL_46_37]|nr:MAG: hypothetical protein A3D27_02770 [Omnitrophica WOR_2 bacterium RIFCSPHIGHO2_02_FULL_46_37]
MKLALGFLWKMQDKIKLVIFDLDGTLVDAYQAIIKSVNFTLSEMGYPEASRLRIRRAVGWGDKRLLGVFVKEKDIEYALVIYRRHHRLSLKSSIKLLPYANKILRYLTKNGFKIAIASNRPTEFTGIILRRLALKKYFDYVLCADRLAQGKPHPEILLKIIKKLKVRPAEVVYVGDMAIDVKTAQAAGIKPIAISGGSSPLDEIKKARPFRIIKSLAFLKKILPPISA